MVEYECQNIGLVITKSDNLLWVQLVELKVIQELISTQNAARIGKTEVD